MERRLAAGAAGPDLAGEGLVEPATELERANDIFRREFPHAAGALPYFHNTGRGLLPPQWARPALIVPLDGPYVVEEQASNRPISWLLHAFTDALPRFSRLLETLRGSLRVEKLPTRDVDGTTPYFPNPFYGPMDATVLSGMIATLRPRRLVEIGSGFSTRIARHAAKQRGLATSIVSIDPDPRSEVAVIADPLVTDSVVNASFGLFEELGADDILFLDGSHLSFSGSDCPHVFLEILPRLAAGVCVHIHDVFLPNDYPQRLQNRFYNEQQLLAAFLAGNRDYEVLLPVNYLHTLGLCDEGVSFWMRRVRKSTAGERA